MALIIQLFMTIAVLMRKVITVAASRESKKRVTQKVTRFEK